MQAQLIETIDVGNTLGEGVLFRESDSTVWWTDIQSSKLYCLAWPGLVLNSYPTPERVCAFAFVEGADDKLLVAFETGFAYFLPSSGQVIWIAKTYEQGGGVRMNDGRTDPNGNFWVGSMVERPLESGEAPSGQLYRLIGKDKTIVGRNGIHISNGLCWSADGKYVYFADSPTGVVQRASYDLNSCQIGAFEDVYKFDGVNPDGAITDRDGNYLSALWNGSCVAVISEQGKRVFDIELPTPQITCLALGGPKLNLLFVTSASDGLPQDDNGASLDRQAGNLFILETDFDGCPSVPAKPNLT